jgi:hypothetical protein
VKVFSRQRSPISKTALLFGKFPVFARSFPGKSSKYGATVEWYWQGKQRYREEKLSKCQFLNHRSHQGLHWDRTRAYAVRDRHQACVMPRPDTYTRRFATADSKANTKHIKSTARPLPIRTATHGCTATHKYDGIRILKSSLTAPFLPTTIDFIPSHGCS